MLWILYEYWVDQQSVLGADRFPSPLPPQGCKSAASSAESRLNMQLNSDRSLNPNGRHSEPRRAELAIQAPPMPGERDYA
eukprot:891691-Alexandrium_andersonii.AAC.1